MKEIKIGSETVYRLSVEVRATDDGKALYIGTGEVDSAIELAKVIEQLDGDYMTIRDENGLNLKVPLRQENET